MRETAGPTIAAQRNQLKRLSLSRRPQLKRRACVHSAQRTPPTGTAPAIVVAMLKLTFLTFVLTLATSSCAKTDSNSATSSKTAGAAATASNTIQAKGGAIDESKFGGKCTKSFDCPRTDFASSCSVECQKPNFDAPEGYCQLRTLATSPDQTCHGNRSGADSEGSIPSTVTPVIRYCDMNAGVYCNETVHKCEPVKAIGAECKTQPECGRDGACAQGKCVAAGAAGGPAIERRCDSKSRRVGDQCEARKADGEACKESDQCLSSNCVMNNQGTTCQPAKPISCNLR